MFLHWHNIKAKGNERVTQESSYQSLSFYLSIRSNITVFPMFSLCFFPHFPMFFIPYVFAPHWPKWVPSGPRHRALRNCSRQASRLPKGPGAAKAACSWPEGVCKVWTNLGGWFQGTKKQLIWLVVEPTPLKKYESKLDNFPNFRGEHKNCLSCHHLVDGSEIRRSPVDMVNIYVNIPIIHMVLYIPGGEI